jgi:hypothetical protein
MHSTATQRQVRHFAEFRRRHEQEAQERRHQVIAEFNGDLQAMAAQILRYRHGVAQMAGAINWLQQGAPCAAFVRGVRLIESGWMWTVSNW